MSLCYWQFFLTTTWPLLDQYLTTTWPMLDQYLTTGWPLSVLGGHCSHLPLSSSVTLVNFCRWLFEVQYFFAVIYLALFTSLCLCLSLRYLSLFIDYSRWLSRGLLYLRYLFLHFTFHTSACVNSWEYNSKLRYLPLFIDFSRWLSRGLLYHRYLFRHFTFHRPPPPLFISRRPVPSLFISQLTVQQSKHLYL